MELNVAYPIGYLTGCVVLAGLLTLLFYYRNQANKNYSVFLVKLLAALRFTTIFIILFLLLEPLLNHFSETYEKPILVWAQDKSSSILLNKDSAFYQNEYQEKLNTALKELEEKFQVDYVSFGDKIGSNADSTFTESYTDYSTLIQHINENYAQSNLKAVVVATDGIYNRGANPLYEKFNEPLKLFTLMMGDSSTQRDVGIRNIRHNELAYLGNSFPLEVSISANDFSGQESEISILHNGKTIQKQKVSINAQQFNQQYNFVLQADSVGVQRYTVVVSPLDGEATKINNQRDFFVEVIDSRQRILILAEAPHPDIASIRSALESQLNLSVQFELESNYQLNPNEWNLIVWHGAKEARIRELSEYSKKYKIPLWYILPPQTSSASVQSIHSGLRPQWRPGQRSNAKPTIDKRFNKFNIEENTRKSIESWPPLDAPFGPIQLTPTFETFLKQKIGNVRSNDPLMGFVSNTESKIALTFGEGLWRWKLEDYRLNGSHQAFHEIVFKTIQFLAAKDDKSRFRITNKKQYAENEQIVFEAEVYNKSYELVEGAEIDAEFTNENKESFSYQFIPTQERYKLQAGPLPVGVYNYTIKAKYAGENFSKNGTLRITPIQIEAANTQANFALLNEWALQNSGKAINMDSMMYASQIILDSVDTTSRIHTEEERTPLIHLKWIFFVLLISLSAEWLLRRMYGGW